MCAKCYKELEVSEEKRTLPGAQANRGDVVTDEERAGADKAEK